MTICHCDNPKPGIFGRFQPPAYVCGSCGRNLTARVESGNLPRPLYPFNITFTVDGHTITWTQYHPDVDTARAYADVSVGREYSGEAEILSVNPA